MHRIEDWKIEENQGKKKDLDVCYHVCKSSNNKILFIFLLSII